MGHGSGVGLSVDWLGIKEFQHAVEKATRKIDAETRLTVATLSSMLIKDAMANFEGAHKKNEPHVGGSKPNIVTGTLRRSIRNDGINRVGFGIYTTTVGPSTEYGRRVEMGFKGTDSAGRTFAQPAYPYFGPAVRNTRVAAAALAAKSFTPTNIFT